MKKIITIMMVLIIMLGFTSLKASDNPAKYFLSYSDTKADAYASENFESLLKAEKGSALIKLEDVRISKGIYAYNVNELASLPTFMYPVYANDELSYVYTIYDNGSGEYEGTLSKTYVEEILTYGANNKDDAGLWIEDNGNTLLLTSSKLELISSNPNAKEVEHDYNLAELLDNDKFKLAPIDIVNEQLSVSTSNNTIPFVVTGVIVVVIVGLGIVLVAKKKA